MRTDELPQLVADTTFAPFDAGRVLAHIGNHDGDRAGLVVGGAVEIVDEERGPYGAHITAVDADGVIHATIAAPERIGR